MSTSTPLTSPYFSTMTRFQRGSLFEAYFYLHLPSSALFNIPKFLMIKSPFLLMHAVTISPNEVFSHELPLLKGNLFESSQVSSTSFLEWWIGTCSIFTNLTEYFLISVNLPPFEKYSFFHMANLLMNLFSTSSQTAHNLKDAPNGRPNKKKEAFLFYIPIKKPNPPRQGLPIGRSSLFARFIFSPKTALNNIRINASLSLHKH